MDSDEPNEIILTEEEKAENNELFQQYLKEECDRRKETKKNGNW
jgi:hypothetical protein